MSDTAQTPEDDLEVSPALQDDGDPDFENLSDDEFMNLPEPVAPVAGSEDDSEVEVGAEISADDDEFENPKEIEPDQPTAVPEEVGDQPTSEVDEPVITPEPVAEVEPVAAVTETEQPTNYEALYKEIMKPFKANGREFKPSNSEEAVRLMQLGANYTKKMQSLKPNLKLMRMLENQELLDEGKLNYLIDLHKKDPQAILKLIKDAQIDPLDLDTSSEPAYTPGNHQVSDAEMAFTESLNNVMLSDTGKSTISHINEEWDTSSKEAIYAEPELLGIIDEQRATGVYDQIYTEIERQKILGTLPSMSFIKAYKYVGDQLYNQGKLQPTDSQPNMVSETPSSAEAVAQILETRPATPKRPVTSAKDPRSVSPAPRTSSSPATSFNPLTMSDEEIMAINSLKV